MNKKQILLFFLLFAVFNLVAQRSYIIQPMPIAPTIDGNLESESWRTIPITENFTTTLPSFGKTPQLATKVQMAYDEQGVYIAAECQSNKIRDEGSQRDKFGTGDYFSVGLDTWNDDQNAFEFAVNAAGQRIDIRQSSTLTEQFYDAYWQVQTKVTVDGWTLEMFIPYTALRFPKQTEQDWGLQFTRYDRSTGETSTWNPQDPLIQDKVLQYGQLEGLKQIYQRNRLGISLLNEMNWDKNTITIKDANIRFSSNSTLIVPAVDGRIGFGSASTFDFSIFPDYGLGDSFFFGFPSPVWQISSDLPRQINHEESGIFNKSNILEPTFNISSTTAGEVLRKNPGDIIFPYEDFQLLQKSRFTTRTKNNIGIGISNSIYSRPEYGITSGLISSFFETPQLPHNPIYNNITIEKCFRNNSWIQISNGINFIDQSLWSNRSALSTQLRDKSNQYEVAGTLNVQSQGSYSVASGFIALGKVNGKITYGASYTAPKKTMNGLLILPPAVTPLPGSQMERFSAHLTQRNFSPAQKKWLNTTRSVELIFENNKNSFEQDLPELNLSWAGLNKKFQNIGFNFMFSPFRETIFLDFGDIRLPQKQFFPIGFGGSFTTDARKKLVLPVSFTNKWVIGSDQYNANFNFQPYWVLHRKWIFSIAQFSNIETNQLISTTIPGASTSRFAENRHVFSNRSRASLQFIPNRRLYFELGGQFRMNSQFNRKIYELSSDGQIKNINFPFTYNPRIDKTQSINASITWLINSYSQLRIGTNNSSNDDFGFVGFPGIGDELPIQTTSNNYNISFVWNIYKN